MGRSSMDSTTLYAITAPLSRSPPPCGSSPLQLRKVAQLSIPFEKLAKIGGNPYRHGTEVNAGDGSAAAENAGKVWAALGEPIESAIESSFS